MKNIQKKILKNSIKKAKQRLKTLIEKKNCNKKYCKSE